MEMNLNIVNAGETRDELPTNNHLQLQSNGNDEHENNRGFHRSDEMVNPNMMQLGINQQQQGREVQHTASSKTGVEKLGEFSGIFIKQRFLIKENLTGCDQENQYQVFKLHEDGHSKMGNPIFKAREKAGFWVRQCSFPNCRPFEIRLNYLEYDKAILLTEKPFILMQRPRTCTFLCCNRPETTLKYVENGADEDLGKILLPWTCWDYHADVQDANGSLKYKIIANCCQLGFCCQCPWGPCQHIRFDVKSPMGEHIGTLEKYSKGCIKASLEDSSNLVFKFPENVDLKEKTLLLAAAVFLDFRFFEEKPVHEQ